MKLITQTPQKALKAFSKQKPLLREVDLFKTHLIALLDQIKIIESQPKDESEEHLKNNLRDFLRDTYYRDTHSINTKDKKDLVVHLGKGTDTEVGVIIEAKRPNNTAEMVTDENPNKKALHELILYYFDERTGAENNQLKHLIITNVLEWYILDANLFDKHVYRNTQLKKLYDTKRNDKKDNPWFYEEVSKVIAKMDVDLPCTYFDIRKYDTILRNNKKEDDRELIALYKILAPQHLLKIASPNDSNALNEKFYKELLHLIGLEEAKEGGKNIIRRKKDSKNAGSLIELTIDALLTEDVLHRLPDASMYGTSKEERAYNVALELCITWINRILFLKLLEGQLVSYHQGNRDYRFLNSGMIHDFDELFKLFHKVLAVNVQDRSAAVQQKYSHVPYLNSSLFEISELEDQTIKINALDNGLQLDLIGTSILKDPRKKFDKLPTLQYLFEFLDAYDFASEGTEDMQEENKSLINASVLGKVFEKINGYKDGSIFTPAFITMYMCRQSIRLAVVEKFNESLGEGTFERYEDLKNYSARLFKTQDILKANEVINSLRICDPAVGSGHFLVSSLNEIICIKAELRILADKEGNSISGYEVEIINDELIITDPRNRDSTLEYKMLGGKPISKDAQRLQKLLFHEKQTIIENCLFGVDINPNSVKICRLRLWIELLKNAYYREESNFSELETLPNIDINIKCGNSLLSRFALDADLSKALKSIKYDIKAYRGFVQDYKKEKSREVKRGLQKIIDGIKSDFRTEIGKNDPKQLRLYKLGGELYNLVQPQMFELSAKEKKTNKEKQVKLEGDIQKLTAEIEEIKSNAIYKNAFEWRFEFPEVLNNAGEFEGFDVVIGNPPYMRIQELKEYSEIYKNFYKSAKTGNYDIYVLFIEKCSELLKKTGHLQFILPHKFLIADFGKGIREILSSSKRVNEIIHFGHEMIFEGVTTYTCLLSMNAKENAKLVFAEIDSNSLGSDIAFSEFDYLNIPTSEPWIFKENQSLSIIDKIQRNPKKLENALDKVFSGIQTSADKIYSIIGIETDGIVAGKSKNGDEDICIEIGLLKPLIKGDDIKRYSNLHTNVFVIFPYIFEEGEAKPMKENFIKTNFPMGYNYLKKYENELRSRENGKMNFEEKWFLYNYPKNLFLSNQKKLVSPDITFGMNITKDDGSFCVKNGAYGITITLEYQKYENIIIAILNSKLLWYYLQNTGNVLRGGYFRFNTKYILPFPLPNFIENIDNKLSDLVNSIFNFKQRGEDTTALEREIDRLVYGLYELTEEEVQVVEGAG